MSHVYCPECGFQNPEASNYCARCGTLLVRDEAGSDTTMSYTPDDGDDDAAAVVEEIKAEGLRWSFVQAADAQESTSSSNRSRRRSGARRTATSFSTT